MGEVYRAHDTKLKRDVALKVLPEALTTDPDRLARFQREAEVLASLNHPHIAQIHGFENSHGVPALVLELVEGLTLEEILSGLRRAAGRSQSAGDPGHQPPATSLQPGVGLPVDEAVAIARQIAEALDAAHARGIVHRDLKPSNIKVRDDGAVKVLDFGLAKAFQDPTTPRPHDLGDAAASPTITTPAMTAMGVILGTAAYMAPEQARGKPVDKRADIWAFGCVLYEMLTGRRAFAPSTGSGSSRAESSEEGEDVADTLAAVLRGDIDWGALPADTPPGVRRLLRRCLERDPKRRVRDIGDALLELEEAAHGQDDAPPREDAAMPRPRRHSLALLALVALVAATVAGLGVWQWLPTAELNPTVARFGFDTDPPLFMSAVWPDVAISPDGATVVYLADPLRQALYARRIDELSPRLFLDLGPRLAQPMVYPFYSPNGDWVGFLKDNNLNKVAVSGGPPVTVASGVGWIGGASWGTDDLIVFGGPPSNPGLFRVAATGGEPQRLTTPEGAAWHIWPTVLPDAETVLFEVREAAGSSRIAVLDLESGHQKVLVQSGRSPHYASSGHLVYVEDSNVLAAPFDSDRLETTGPALPVLEDVMAKGDGGAVNLALAATGSLVYVTGGGGLGFTSGNLVWVDRDGREQPMAGPQESAYQLPRLSPDGTRLAVVVQTSEESDIWVHDLGRGTRWRLTLGGFNSFPAWTNDGRRVTYVSNRSGSWGLYSQVADGSRDAELLLAHDNDQVYTGNWSGDDRVLVFEAVAARGDGREDNPGDIFTLRPGQAGDPSPLVTGPFYYGAPVFSPDGRWVAYVSGESGWRDVYVQSYPDGTGRRVVSTSGGTEPVWSRDGRQLFYRNGTELWAAPVVAGDAFDIGRPELVFDRPYAIRAGTSPNYDVSPDGQRFLMVKPASASPITVVLNWAEELKAMVPHR